VTIKISVASKDFKTHYNLPVGKTLFGFESFRLTLWGADIMTEIGLKWLPTLRTSDVILQGDELDSLEREAKTVLLHAREISEKTGAWEDIVEDYANNLLEAIQLARQVDGQIWIG